MKKNEETKPKIDGILKDELEKNDSENEDGIFFTIQDINLNNKFNEIKYNGATINSLTIMKFLGPRSQLNDDVIDIFSHLIQKQFENYYYVTSNFISENPVTNILEYHLNYLPTTLFTDKNYEKLFFPILDYKLGHWVLVVVDIKTKSIWYYDSILFNESGSIRKKLATKYLNLIKNALEEKNNKKNQEFSLWIYDDAPQQINEYDCGVYVCAIMYYISHNKRLSSFDDEKAKNFRKKIKHAIISGSL